MRVSGLRVSFEHEVESKVLCGQYMPMINQYFAVFFKIRMSLDF